MIAGKMKQFGVESEKSMAHTHNTASVSLRHRSPAHFCLQHLANRFAPFWAYHGDSELAAVISSSKIAPRFHLY